MDARLFLRVLAYPSCKKKRLQPFFSSISIRESARNKFLLSHISRWAKWSVNGLFISKTTAPPCLRAWALQKKRFFCNLCKEFRRLLTFLLFYQLKVLCKSVAQRQQPRFRIPEWQDGSYPAENIPCGLIRPAAETLTSDQ